MTDPACNDVVWVWRRTSRAESFVTLDYGATLMLFTDVLVERRDEPLDARIGQLLHTVRRLAGPGIGPHALSD